MLHASVWLGGCSTKYRLVSESCEGWDEVAVPYTKFFMIHMFDITYATCHVDTCPILH